MRFTRICAKCDARKFYVQPAFQVPDTGSGDRTAVLPAVSVESQSAFGARMEYGVFECWTCAGCGYTELYASVVPLELAAKEHPDQVRTVDASPGQEGPFR
jgi:predicted nucleic-acid-binding Zn-ribbon protein